MKQLNQFICLGARGRELPEAGCGVNFWVVGFCLFGFCLVFFFKGDVDTWAF